LDARHPPSEQPVTGNSGNGLSSWKYRWWAILGSNQ
jgi:hypothetical protein